MTGIGPRVIQVVDFASSRAPELQALHELSHDRYFDQDDMQRKVVDQKNQRRRRANAFNSYKMPLKLRLKSQNKRQKEQELIQVRGEQVDALSSNQKQREKLETSAHTMEKEKERCRKHRRRPHKLIAERAIGSTFVTDSSRVLRTHIWHAKRMKMEEKWGIVLPKHRADKSVSAALEALRKKAIIHDMSYYGLLELYGYPQVILEALQLISDPAGSDFHSIKFLAGNLEGKSVLYHLDKFPNGAICPVTFMWRPLGVDYKNGQYNIIDNLEKTKRQLWLWIHPAAFMEAAKSIANACQSIMSENDRIEIHDRRGAMSRFRLRGRLADAILSSICKAPSSSSQFQEEMGENDSDHNDGFLKHEIANITTTRNVQSVENVIQSQKKDHQTAKIFSVSVKDPRTYQKSGFIEDCDDSRLSLLTEPSQDKLNESNGDIKCPITGESLLDPKVKVNENELEPSLEEISKSIEAVLSWARTPGMSLMNIHANAPTVDKQEKAKICDTSPVPCSLLWSHNQRTKLSQSFEKDNILNERVFRRRKEIKVRKGFVDHEIKDASPLEEPLHLLLVKVNNTFPHTSGWDLILLPEYSPSLLKTISFAGALVIGLEEDAAIQTVLKEPSFPRDFPDTLAGHTYWSERMKELEAVYLKRPKAKRVSYEKNHVLSPFGPQWNLLFNQEVNTSDAATNSRLQMCVLRGGNYMEPFNFYERSAPILPMSMPTLVRAYVSFPRKGNITETSNVTLYLPRKQDVEAFHRSLKWQGVSGTNVHDVFNTNLLGFVTSAVYDKPKSNFRIMAFCGCDQLQRLIQEQQEILMSGTGMNLPMALCRNGSSTFYRPVFLEVLS